MINYIVDTDLYIDLLKRKEWARIFFRQGNQRIYYCVITRKELLAGCRGKAERKEALELLSLHREIKLTSKIGETSCLLLEKYRNKSFEVIDSLIAACALIKRMPLVTRNLSRSRLSPAPQPAVTATRPAREILHPCLAFSDIRGAHLASLRSVSMPLFGKSRPPGLPKPTSIPPSGRSRPNRRDATKQDSREATSSPGAGLLPLICPPSDSCRTPRRAGRWLHPGPSTPRR